MQIGSTQSLPGSISELGPSTRIEEKPTSTKRVRPVKLGFGRELVSLIHGSLERADGLLLASFSISNLRGHETISMEDAAQVLIGVGERDPDFGQRKPDLGLLVHEKLFTGHAPGRPTEGHQDRGFGGAKVKSETVLGSYEIYRLDGQHNMGFNVIVIRSHSGNGQIINKRHLRKESILLSKSLGKDRAGGAIEKDSDVTGFELVP